MKTNIFRLVSVGLVLFIFAIVVNSCKKDRPDNDTQSSVDNSICEGEFSRIFPQTNHIAVNDSGVQKTGLPVPFNSCPDYWIDSLDIANGFPITMWMFFGTDNDGDSLYETGCAGSDGKTRQGIIKAVFSGPWHQAGSTVTMYLKNYYVNSLKFDGSVAVTNNGNSFTQTVSNGKCTNGTEWTILWSSTRTIAIQVGDTLNPLDDISTVSGNASGTDRNSKEFSVEIDASNPLVKAASCPYIGKGIQTIKLAGKKDRIINYGDGTCDNKAKLTIDGNEFEFTLQ